ncbi:MAG TPA: acyl-CoA thioesterase [Pseudomonadales bacterium]|jgi:acyl-CoA thioesterase FadM
MSLKLPAERGDYPFHARIPVRIDDLIGGLHVGNSTLVSYLNEVQMQFFTALGFPQLMVDGLIPMNHQLEMAFLAESRYGDTLDIGVAMESFDDRAYTLIYRLVNTATDKAVCEARMHMIFFDVQQKKRGHVPQSFIDAYQQLAQRSA